MRAPKHSLFDVWGVLFAFLNLVVFGILHQEQDFPAKCRNLPPHVQEFPTMCGNFTPRAGKSLPRAGESPRHAGSRPHVRKIAPTCRNFWSCIGKSVLTSPATAVQCVQVLASTLDLGGLCMSRQCRQSFSGVVGLWGVGGGQCFKRS